MADAVSVVIPTRDRSPHRRRHGASGAHASGASSSRSSSSTTVRATARRRRSRALGDPRVTVLRNSASRGVAHARNRGIERATHPWIAFLDDDDRWSPDKLRVQLDRARAEDADFVYTAGLAVAADDGRVLCDVHRRSRPQSCDRASAAATSSSRARPTCSRAPSSCGVSVASTSRSTTSRTGICGSA